MKRFFGYFLPLLLIIFQFILPGLLSVETISASTIQLAAQRLSYFLIPVIAGGVIFIQLISPKKYSAASPRIEIIFPIFLIAATTILSAFGHSITIFGLSLGLLDYLRYPLLSIVLINTRAKDLRNLIKVFFFFCAIQSPIIIFQYLRSREAGDYNAGTLGFGGQTILGVILCYWLYSVLSDPKRSFIVKVISVFLVIGAGFAGDSTGLILNTLMVIFTFVVFRYGLRSIGRILLIGLITGVFLLSLLKFVQQSADMFGAGVKVLLDPDRMVYELVNLNGRTGMTLSAIDMLTTEPLAIFNGLGINAFYKGQVGVLSGNIRGDQLFLSGDARASDIIYIDLPIFGQIAIYKLANLGAFQPIRVLVETGLFGLLSHFLLLWSVWLIYRRFTKISLSIRENQLFWGMFFFYAFWGTIYAETWRLDLTALPFWLFVSLMIRVYLDQRVTSPEKLDSMAAIPVVAS